MPNCIGKPHLIKIVGSHVEDFKESGILSTEGELNGSATLIDLILHFAALKERVLLALIESDYPLVFIRDPS